VLTWGMYIAMARGPDTLQLGLTWLSTQGSRLAHVGPVFLTVTIGASSIPPFYPTFTILNTLSSPSLLFMPQRRAMAMKKFMNRSGAATALDRSRKGFGCEAPNRRLTLGIITWIVLGLIAGALAKTFMPEDDPGGIVITILFGIAGTIVGGFIAVALGIATVWMTSTSARSCWLSRRPALLFAYRMLVGQRSRS
jgi:uncharacterized membrane protein YeaQ/YmgE (transglycosylase-associated protein family)